MNEPQPHARISRRIIIKDIAYGILLFICLMLVYVPLGLLLSSATPETLEPGSIAFIYLVMFIVYTIIVFLAVPIIVAILLIRDITRIIKDLDPIAWYKRWYRILAFCALILILIMVVLGLGASGGFQTKPVGFSIVNVVAGEHSVQVAPSVAGEGLIHVIKVSFLIISLTIIAIVFVMTAYVTFFIDETESNKRRVSFASDIFKTILGFLTGLITAVFGLR